MTAPPSHSLRKRLFAWAMARSGTAYEAANEARKRALFGSLHGAILEIGPGAGSNLRFYQPDAQWTGVEPNPYMHPYLLRTIQSLGRPMERYHIDSGDSRGIRLPAEDASVDAVVSTLVMCSVPNPEDSLQEILRVLKPGGRFAFIEHVAAPPGTRRRRVQDFIQPLWSWIGDGCHPNRETWRTIQGAGFARVELEHYVSDGGGLASPHIAGTAVKA